MHSDSLKSTLGQKTYLWIEFFKQAFFSEKHIWIDGTTVQCVPAQKKSRSQDPACDKGGDEINTALPPFYLQSVKSWFGDIEIIEINPWNGNSHFRRWLIRPGNEQPGWLGWAGLGGCCRSRYQSDPTDQLTNFLPSFLPQFSSLFLFCCPFISSQPDWPPPSTTESHFLPTSYIRTCIGGNLLVRPIQRGSISLSLY